MLKPLGQVIDIARYPVKGFPGESLPEVSLNIDSGVPGDRHWAIRNGAVSVANEAPWTACQAFVRLTKDAGLSRYHLQKNATNNLLLCHPKNGSVQVDYNKGNRSLLSTWFGYQETGFVRAQKGVGFWDHSDAKISIINLTTVNALSKAAGADIAASRFRGNFLIETNEPWEEFSFVGKRLRIGGVELEVLRPIDRCKATSVNPETADLDINVPHLLASQFGHIFCGVYARVVKSGTIAVGSSIVLGANVTKAVTATTSVSTAPPVRDWPRPMRVLSRMKESQHVTSFWLEDPLATLIEPIAPASYLRVHSQDSEGPIARSYTVSAWSKEGRQLRISVKNEGLPARFSPWLHKELQPGNTMMVSGPFVDPSLLWRPNLSARPVLIVTAGIGITVATSILSAMREEGDEKFSQHSIRVAHGVRNSSELALWQEILDSVAISKGATAKLFLSQSTVPPSQPVDVDASSGRIDLNQVVPDFDLKNAQVFLCGPVDFARSMRATLIQLGAVDEAIHEDSFTSPKHSSVSSKKPSESRPFDVYFHHHGETVQKTTWSPAVGTLLHLADAEGIALPANCRSGACRACLRPVSGDIEYLVEPVSPAPKNWTYLCCAAPLSDIEVLQVPIVDKV